MLFLKQNRLRLVKQLVSLATKKLICPTIEKSENLSHSSRLENTMRPADRVHCVPFSLSPRTPSCFDHKTISHSDN